MKKRNLRKESLLTFLFFVSFGAQSELATAAEKIHFCAKLSDLSSAVQDCEGNENYAAEAIHCVDRLRAAVGLAKQALVTGLAANAASAQTQGNSLSGAGQNYTLVQATLDPLIARAEASKAEVKSYVGDIVLPEDFENPEMYGNNPQSFLKNSNCYQENKEVLNLVLADMESIKRDLLKTRTAAAGKAQDSNARAEGVTTRSLSSSGLQIQANQPVHTLTPVLPSGHDVQPASGISGVEETKAKDKAP